MTTPRLKPLCRGRALKVGHYVGEFATPGIGHILKQAGCDFVLFDMEHSAFGYETLKTALRYFEAAGLPAIVRPPSRAYDHIARALDSGAEGLMPPMVSSAEECRRILGFMKYAPDGQRGVALGIAHDNYAGGEVAGKLAAANARTVLIPLIETRSGVEDVDAIAALDGVDGLWIGHFDLTCSLGIPGRFEHPDFVAAVEAVAAACARHGKSLGRLVNDVDEGVALFGQGHDFICYSGDVWALGAAVRAGVEGIRRGADACVRS